MDWEDVHMNDAYDDWLNQVDGKEDDDPQMKDEPQPEGPRIWLTPNQPKGGTKTPKNGRRGPKKSLKVSTKAHKSPPSKEAMPKAIGPDLHLHLETKALQTGVRGNTSNLVNPLDRMMMTRIRLPSRIESYKDPGVKERKKLEMEEKKAKKAKAASSKKKKATAAGDTKPNVIINCPSSPSIKCLKKLTFTKGKSSNNGAKASKNELKTRDIRTMWTQGTDKPPNKGEDEDRPEM